MNKKTAQKILEKVKSDYNKISQEFSNSRHFHWQEFPDFIPYIKDNDKLIDLGCGNGRFLDFIQKHRKVHYLGIDNSSQLLAVARKNHPHAKFIQGDLLNIPTKEQVDVIVAIASFHHIPSKKLRQKSLQEIHKHLKDQGILILTVWNLAQAKYRKFIWLSYLKWIFSLGKYDIHDTFIPWGKSGIKRYYHSFTPKGIKKLLRQNKFQILKLAVGNNITIICKKES